MSEIVKEVRHVDDSIVVVVVGELTLRESPDFHGSLIELCAQAPKNLIVNLTGVKFIDSSGLGTLTDVFRRMKRNQVRIVRMAKKVGLQHEPSMVDLLAQRLEYGHYGLTADAAHREGMD